MLTAAGCYGRCCCEVTRRFVARCHRFKGGFDCPLALVCTLTIAACGGSSGSQNTQADTSGLQVDTSAQAETPAAGPTYVLDGPLNDSTTDVFTFADTLLVQFPVRRMEDVGCPGEYYMSPDSAHRRYHWYIAMRFPWGDYPDNHMMGVYASITLPVGTAAQMLADSIGHAEVKVVERRGEPPLPLKEIRPQDARVTLDASRVQMRIVDADAVKAFLAPGADSVVAGWCEGEDFRHQSGVKIRTSSSAAR